MGRITNITNWLRSKLSRKKSIPQPMQQQQPSLEEIAQRRAKREAAENAALGHLESGGRKGELKARQVLVDADKAVIAQKLAEQLKAISGNTTRWNSYFTGALEVTSFTEACKKFSGRNKLEIFTACHTQLTDPLNESHVLAMDLLNQQLQKFRAGNKSINSISLGRLIAPIFAKFILGDKIRL